MQIFSVLVHNVIPSMVAAVACWELVFGQPLVGFALLLIEAHVMYIHLVLSRVGLRSRSQVGQ